MEIGAIDKIEIGLVANKLLPQELLAYLPYVIILNGLWADIDVFLFHFVAFWSFDE